MADVCVLTTVLGGTDNLRDQPEQTVQADFVALTEPDSGLRSSFWEVRQMVSLFPGRPRLSSRVPKCLPHLFVTHPIVIWIDANMQITSSRFVEWCTGQGRAPMTTWTHPQRDCIYDEVRIASALPKYLGQPMQLQAAHYRAEGHPPKGGLFACGTIVSRADDPVRQKLGEAWLYEQEVWTDLDQVSLPVVSRRLSEPIGLLMDAGGTLDPEPANELDNPYIRIASTHLHER